MRVLDHDSFRRLKSAVLVMCWLGQDAGMVQEVGLLGQDWSP